MGRAVGSHQEKSLRLGDDTPPNVFRMCFSKREVRILVARVLSRLARSHTATYPRKPCTQRNTTLVTNVRDPHGLPQKNGGAVNITWRLFNIWGRTSTGHATKRCDSMWTAFMARRSGTHRWGVGSFDLTLFGFRHNRYGGMIYPRPNDRRYMGIYGIHAKISNV